jgi:hypothetical protein
MFQLELLVNKKANSLNNVFYIDNLMFLMQTLSINIQFVHILKLACMAHHMGKILNKSVTKMHYIFENETHFSELTYDNIKNQ